MALYMILNIKMFRSTRENEWKLQIFFYMFTFYLNVIDSIVPNGMGGMNPNEYGPYRIEVKEYEKCKGPKREECTSNYLTRSTGPQELKVTIEMNLTKSCIIDHFRMTSKVFEANGRKQLVNYNMDKPCQHFAIGPVLRTFGNVTKNCALPPGIIRVTLDIVEQSHAFFGVNFFYGEFEFKVVVTAKNSNIFCLRTRLVFAKRT